MKEQNADAVGVVPDAVSVEQLQQIADLAIKYRLPSMFSFREHVEAGGLISYGQHLGDSYRRAATYVDRIFKGARPAELPIEQSTKLELGSRLIKSTIQEQRRGRQRPDNFAPACRSGLRCA